MKFFVNLHIFRHIYFVFDSQQHNLHSQCKNTLKCSRNMFSVETVCRNFIPNVFDIHHSRSAFKLKMSKLKIDCEYAQEDCENVIAP